MTNQLIPHHASLPLWKDKSDQQKSEVLESMSQDLEIYAGALKTQIPDIVIKAKRKSNDEKKSLLLSAYQQIMGDSNLSLIKKLKLVVPSDHQERQDVVKAIGFISDHPNALNMNCEFGHVTGSALVIHPESHSILLHKHKKLGIWLQFGGHPDYETQIENVAKREAIEESGLTDLRLVSIYNDVSVPVDVEIQKIAQKQSIPEHYHYDMRFLFVTKDPKKTLASEGESKDFWWMTIRDALNLPQEKITPPVRRLIGKAEIYLQSHHNL